MITDQEGKGQRLGHLEFCGRVGTSQPTVSQNYWTSFIFKRLLRWENNKYFWENNLNICSTEIALSHFTWLKFILALLLFLMLKTWSDPSTLTLSPSWHTWLSSITSLSRDVYHQHQVDIKYSHKTMLKYNHSLLFSFRKWTWEAEQCEDAETRCKGITRWTAECTVRF